MGFEDADRNTGRADWVPRASLALFALSYFLTVVVEPNRGPVRGYQVFFGIGFGFLLYLFFSVAALVVNHEPRLFLVLLVFLPLLANVVYWRAVTWRLKGRTRWVVTLGVLAVLLGLSALVVPIGMAFSRRSSWSLILYYREGYWVWLGSMALLVVEGWFRRGDRMSKTQARELAQYWDD